MKVCIDRELGDLSQSGGCEGLCMSVSVSMYYVCTLGYFAGNHMGDSRYVTGTKRTV